MLGQDDTFTAVCKDEIDDFHDHLNEQNADIQFTKEIEENWTLPFLDGLVSRGNNELRTTVYRKLTHTDMLIMMIIIIIKITISSFVIGLKTPIFH